MNLTDNKCRGCGVKLQTDNVLEEGFTLKEDNLYCVRCFRLNNYGEYFKSTQVLVNIEDCIENIKETKDLVLLVIDIINIPINLDSLIKSMDNKMMLVINKRDIIPRSISDTKIKERFKEYNFEDIIIISSYNNYQLDELLSSIKKHKTSKRVHVIGNSNVGKSTLINKMLKNYGESEIELTMSPYLSTTVDALEIKISDDLYLFDTPGFLDRGNILNYVSDKEIKNIAVKKEIRPRTYQLKPGQSLIIGDYVRLDYLEGEKNIFTVYVSNKIKIRRVYNVINQSLKSLNKESFQTMLEEDIVISGLGFIKVVYESKLDLYTLNNVNVYQRRSLF